MMPLLPFFRCLHRMRRPSFLIACLFVYSISAQANEHSVDDLKASCEARAEARAQRNANVADDFIQRCVRKAFLKRIDQRKHAFEQQAARSSDAARTSQRSLQSTTQSTTHNTASAARIYRSDAQSQADIKQCVLELRAQDASAPIQKAAFKACFDQKRGPVRRPTQNSEEPDSEEPAGSAP